MVATVQKQLADIRRAVEGSLSIPVQPNRASSNQGSRLAAEYEVMNQSLLALTTVVGEVDDVAQAGAANTARINGNEPDAAALLEAAFSDTTLTTVLTGTFNLTQPVRVTRGAHVLYLVDAVISSVLEADDAGMFELEDGTILYVYSRNSDLILTGNGNGNSVFRPATENFTLHVDGGAFSGEYKSNISYSGTNVRCIKVAAAQTDTILPAHFIAMGMTGSGPGEQFLDTGSPRLHIVEATNCFVTSNYLNVDTSSRNGLGFAGKQLYVNRNCTYLLATINGAPPDANGSVVLASSAVLNEMEIAFVYPAGLGSITGLTFSGRVVDQFKLTCDAGAGTDVALNLTSGATLILSVLVSSGVFDVSVTTATALFINLNGVRNVTTVGASTLGGSAILNGVADISAAQITDLGLFGGTNGVPNVVAAGNIQGLIAGAALIPTQLMPNTGASSRGSFANLSIGGDLLIGPGFTNAVGVGTDGPVMLSSFHIGGDLDGPGAAGTQAKVYGSAGEVAGTVKGGSPAKAVTLRAATAGAVGVNATVSL